MATRIFDLVFADIVLAADMIDDDPLDPNDFAMFHGAAMPTLDLAFATVDFLAHIENAADTYIDLPTTWHDDESAFHTRYPYRADDRDVVDLHAVLHDAAPPPPRPPSDYQLAHLAELALLLLDPRRPAHTRVQTPALELADTARALCDLWHAPQIADGCVSTIHAYAALFSLFGTPARDDGLPSTADIDPFALMDEASRERIRYAFRVDLLQYDPSRSPDPSVVCRAGYRATVDHRTAELRLSRDGSPIRPDLVGLLTTDYPSVAAALVAAYDFLHRISRHAEDLQAKHDFGQNP